MIDWYSVAVNGIWITGAAVVLAAWSWANWLARTARDAGRTDVRAPAWRTWRSTGWLLVAVGQTFVPERPLWVRGLWLVVLLWAAMDVSGVWGATGTDARRHDSRAGAGHRGRIR